MRAYTNFSPPIKKILKERGQTWNEYANDLAAHYKELKKCGLSDQAQRAYVGGRCHRMDYGVLCGESTHFFMPSKEFCDWLISCVKDIEVQASHVEAVKATLPQNNGCMHFPACSGYHSFAFQLSKNAKDDIIFMSCLVLKGSRQIVRQLAIPLLREAQESSYKEFSHFSKQIFDYIKIVVGLGMYLSCFPDQIKPGIPEDLKHPNHFKGLRARTIGISEKVVMRDGPTPHYRVGHFRFLESERYKNKRGQAVFVHGCFVKGKAETVLAIT